MPKTKEIISSYIQPKKENWEAILERPVQKLKGLEKTVKNILREVENKGDKAVLRYTAKFDKVKFKDYQVSQEEFDRCEAAISPELKEAMQLAFNNISKFHSAHRHNFHVVETCPGVRCWRKLVPIQKVGLYIPSGSAPLFSTVLMLGIPAKLMGCQEVVLCVPPLADGTVHPAILYAAQLTGIKKIYKVGGAQAIAAMAYGTETVPQVYKIFGPGNSFVTMAKQLVSQSGTGIDMPAGPSELMLIADESMPAAYAAADLLSQAEHGPDSQVLMICFSERYLEAVKAALSEQVKRLPRKEIALKALAHSALVVLEDRAQAIEMANEYAAEHLIVGLQDATAVANQIYNASAIFLGHYAPESVGDYASGPNHTLPTSGYAKTYSGVMLESFGKMVTYQQLSPEGLLNIGPAVELMAETEELMAHKNAVSIRLKDIRETT